MESYEVQLISQQLESMTELFNTQFKGTHQRLDKINGQIDKHDDRLRLVEEAERLHIINCPISPQLRQVQDELLTQKTLKSFLVKTFIGGIALGGLVVAVIDLIIK